MGGKGENGVHMKSISSSAVKVFLSILLMISLCPAVAFADSEDEQEAPLLEEPENFPADQTEDLSEGFDQDEPAVDIQEDLAAEAVAAAGQPIEDNPETSEVEGEILVVFDDRQDGRLRTLSTASPEETLDEVNVTITETVIEAGENFGTVVTVEYDSSQDQDTLIEEISALPGVSYAQPNFIYHLPETDIDTSNDGVLSEEVTDESPSVEPLGLGTSVRPNDPGLSLQYALTEYKDGYGGANFFGAWEKVTASHDVTVAVLDTGYREGHEDLKARDGGAGGNILTQYQWDAFTKTEQGVISTPNVPNGDNNGHGTHVVGIVAATTNNSLGIAGASYAANVIPIKVFTNEKKDPGADTATLIAAYNYLLDLVRFQGLDDLRVINMSLGGYSTGNTFDDRLFMEAIEAALIYDILTVCAGGNGKVVDGTRVPRTDFHFPSDYEACVAVTALTASGLNSSYSDYNINKDISTSGDAILSTYGTVYAELNGTSMAAPLVASAFALLWACNPDLSIDEAKKAIYETAQPIIDPARNPAENGSHGRMDVAAAVERVKDDSQNNPRTSIDVCTVSAIGDQYFVGNAVTPKPYITHDGNTLIEGQDYTLTYVHNKTFGAASVVIHGKNSYSGIRAVNFNIKLNLNDPSATLELVGLSSYPYTGSAITPTPNAVRCKYSTGAVITLTKDTDYSIGYSNNMNKGNATIIVTGKGAVSGVVSKNFTITARSVGDPSITIAILDQEYTGNALTPKPEVKHNGKLLTENVDYTLGYSSNTNISDNAYVTVIGKGNYGASVTKTFKIKGVQLTYTAHVQNVGWMPEVSSGGIGGTSGRSLRVEAIKINLVNNTGYAGNITYAAHVQNIGWQSGVSVYSSGKDLTKAYGKEAGTSGRSLRVEAFWMNLDGKLGEKYDIYYRVHAENVGWMGWAKNGELAGTAGNSLRLEAVQVCLVEAGSEPPADNLNGAVAAYTNVPRYIDSTNIGGDVSYSAKVHVQNIGDKSYPTTTGTTYLGTSGQSLRVESLSIALKNQLHTGSINYRTHIQNIGWQDWKKDGMLSGTTGRSLRLEAISLNLTGTMSSNYDIYYRTHIQNIGWTGWAKNGQNCGSAGYSYRMEAMQIVIVKKGGIAPGLNSGYFYQT